MKLYFPTRCFGIVACASSCLLFLSGLAGCTPEAAETKAKSPPPVTEVGAEGGEPTAEPQPAASDNRLPVVVDGDQATTPETPGGYRTLLRGGDIGSWSCRAASESDIEAAQPAWRVSGDSLHGAAPAANLRTAQVYADFELLAEFKATAESRGGIALRGAPLVQLGDMAGQGGSGGICVEGTCTAEPLTQAEQPLGEWNRLYIRMWGNEIVVVLNDQLVVDNLSLEDYWHSDEPIAQFGPLELVVAKGEIEFRKLAIRELLTAQQAREIEAALPAEPSTTPGEPRKVLALARALDHWHTSIPANVRSVQRMGEATGAYRTKITEDITLLAPDSIAQYDAIIMCNNTGSWIEATPADAERLSTPEKSYTPEEATALLKQSLLDYVAGGGGIAGIHAASAANYEWPEYGELLGGYFLNHPWLDEVGLQVEHPNSPLTEAFEGEPFWVADEIYQFRDPYNRDSLMVLLSLDPRRADTSRGQEGVDGDYPVAWIREQGAGRVFYCTLGHKEEIFWNATILDFYLDGIQYAIGDVEADFSPGIPKERFNSLPSRVEPREEAPADAEAFEYADADIPFYVPGGDWGAQDDSWTQMQQPLSPAESMKHLQVPAGFEPVLYASEPDIFKPVAMTWDEAGRLWIIETVDYPNDPQEPGQGHDQIRICEDTNGDGVADKFSVFADGLSIPTSIVFTRGGVLIAQAPDLIFLRDDDGDGVADTREVIMTGWGTYDTHAGPSNLRWGHDNWLWGTVGYAGFEGEIAGEPRKFGQGVFRMRLTGDDIPQVAELEFLASTSNNTWGLGLGERGEVFGSTANGAHSFHVAIPNRYYEGVRGWTGSGLAYIADHRDFHPVTERVRQVDHHGGFTAAAGHALYTARRYPREYWNHVGFVAEPTGHLVHQNILRQQGTSFTSVDGWSFFASDDEWTAPILAEVGPDGCVWVIDWYNYIVQHNPTPHGFETGEGNAYETPLRDKMHGRIYRVEYGEADAGALRDLSQATPEQLVGALADSNMFWRDTAQRLLVERGERDVVPALWELAGSDHVDSLNLNVGAMHALWTLAGLGAIDLADPAVGEALAAALENRSAGVRQAALQVLPASDQAVELILAAEVICDGDPLVQLEALLALARAPGSPAAGRAVAAVLNDDTTAADRWLPAAAIAAAAPSAPEFLTALAEATPQAAARPALAVAAYTVAEHFARGESRGSAAALLAEWSQGDPQLAAAVVRGLAEGWPADATLALEDKHVEQIRQLLNHLPAADQATLIGLANRWQADEGFAGLLDQFVADLTDTIHAETSDDATRAAAATQLISLCDDADHAQLVAAAITPLNSPQLNAGLLEALRQSSAGEVGGEVAQLLPGMLPATRNQALGLLLLRADWTGQLLDAIESQTVRADDLSLAQQQQLLQHPNAQIATRAREIFGNSPVDEELAAVIETLLPVVQTPGDLEHGREVFLEQCSKCHTHSGEGGHVGPDLTGMAVHPKEELLVNIIDPNRSVEGNFRQYTVITLDGLILSGLLAGENATSVELVDAEGESETILREDIEEIAASQLSLMPTGFEKLAEDDLRDLLEFLTHRGQYLPLPLRQQATVVTTRGMFYDEAAQTERLVFDDWSPKTFQNVPFVLIDPQGERVPNAIMLHGPQGKLPPTMPESVSVPCNSAARALHMLGGVSGWGYPLGEEGSVTMIVRLHYADGTTEEHELLNGVHFADYIRQVEVPGSEHAFQLGGQQLRYLAIHPERTDELIESIELVKGADATAPLVMALTIEQ